MIVVADTSPINYLVQVDLQDLLRRLYQRIILPRSVETELTQQGAPPAVSAWTRILPAWVEVHEAPADDTHVTGDLGPGEKDTIILGKYFGAELLLIDERQGTAVARAVGFRVTGTLGILRDSHIAGFVDGNSAYLRLSSQTNFRRSPKLDELFRASLLSR
jgi:predicted nucleic acid-binding protein